MIGNDWDQILKNEYKKDYFKELITYLRKEYQEKTIYPKKSDVFKAFRYTPYKDVKVVILGQDPYHGLNQAEGLSFSVPNVTKRPPSLRNIFKEIEDDLHIPMSDNNSLIPWAKQGVLLLNAVLTVEEKKPASHSGKGWEIFTDNIIRILNNHEDPIVFILWGNYAKEKSQLITNNKHYIIKSAHPSPFSAYNGFFGSRPFSKVNNFLQKNNKRPINWQI